MQTIVSLSVVQCAVLVCQLKSSDFYPPYHVSKFQKEDIFSIFLFIIYVFE